MKSDWKNSSSMFEIQQNNEIEENICHSFSTFCRLKLFILIVHFSFYYIIRAMRNKQVVHCKHTRIHKYFAEAETQHLKGLRIEMKRLELFFLERSIISLKRR